MGAGFASLAQQRRREQASEPGRMLERCDIGPGLCGDCSRQRRRGCSGAVEDRSPFSETCVLIPIEIIDQRIAFRWARRVAGERAIRTSDRGVDRREQFIKGIVGRDLVFDRLVFLAVILVGKSLPSPPPRGIVRRAAAAQDRETSRRQCPIRVGAGDPTPHAQDGMGARELMGRRPDVHARVVENQVIDMDELAFEPQSGAGIGEVSPRNPAVADGALREPLVETRERILRSSQRAGDVAPVQGIGDLVSEWQRIDNLNRNRRYGSYHAVSFRHRGIHSRPGLTIDNYPLSIVIDARTQISDSDGQQPGKSCPSGLRSMRKPIAVPASSSLPDEKNRPFTADELKVVRRAYARQMTAVAGVDNATIEAAFAVVPREAFLGPPPWTASSPFTGYCPLPSRDPVVVYQDLVIALDPARGVNNGSPSLHTNLLNALGPSPATISSISAPAPAIIARFWPNWSARPARSPRSNSTRLRPNGPGHPFPIARTSGSSAMTAPAGPKARPTGST